MVPRGNCRSWKLFVQSQNLKMAFVMSLEVSFFLAFCSLAFKQGFGVSASLGFTIHYPNLREALTSSVLITSKSLVIRKSDHYFAYRRQSLMRGS